MLDPMSGLLGAQLAALMAGALLLLACNWWKMHAGLFVPTAWLAGTGLLAMERLLLAQAGLPWTVWTVGAPWLLPAVAAAWRLRGVRWRPDLASLRSRWAGVGRQARQTRLAFIIEASAGVIIVLWTLSLLRRTFSRPFDGWDALVIWVFKGRVFHESGTVSTAFLTDPQYNIFAHHMDYPLLVPLSVARMYSWMGDQEVLVKGWWALLAGAAASGLYFGLQGLVARTPRLCSLVLAIGMPSMMHYGSDGMAGYAEMPLAVFLLYAGLFLYRWLRNGQPGEFALSALFFGLAGFTKNEGFMTALVGLSLLLLLAFLRRHQARAPILPALLLAGSALVPWQVEKAVYGITGDLNPTVSDLLRNWESRAGTVLSNVAWYASDLSRLNLVWPLLPLLSVAALIFVPRRWLLTLPLLLVIVAQFGVTVAAYVTTPHDVMWHLGTSAARLVFQPVLLGALLGTIYLDMLIERQDLLPHKTTPTITIDGAAAHIATLSAK